MPKIGSIQVLVLLTFCIGICYGIRRRKQCAGHFDIGTSGVMVTNDTNIQVYCKSKDENYKLVIDYAPNDGVPTSPFKLSVLRQGDDLHFVASYKYGQTMRILYARTTINCMVLDKAGVDNPLLSKISAGDVDLMNYYCGYAEAQKCRLNGDICDTAHEFLPMGDHCVYGILSMFGNDEFKAKITTICNKNNYCFFDSATKKLRSVPVSDKRVILDIHFNQAVSLHLDRYIMVEDASGWSKSAKCLVDLKKAKPLSDSEDDLPGKIVAYFPVLATIQDQQEILTELHNEMKKYKSCMNNERFYVMNKYGTHNFEKYLENGRLPHTETRYEGGLFCEDETQKGVIMYGAYTSAGISALLTLCFLCGCFCVSLAKRNFIKNCKPLPKLPWQTGYAEQTQQTMGVANSNSVYGTTTVGTVMGSTMTTTTNASTMTNNTTNASEIAPPPKLAENEKNEDDTKKDGDNKEEPKEEANKEGDKEAPKDDDKDAPKEVTAEGEIPNEEPNAGTPVNEDKKKGSGSAEKDKKGSNDDVKESKKN